MVLARPLRLVTLNVLYDVPSTEVALCHEARFDAVCAELCSLDADVIGLNEVTLRFLKKVLGLDWVREAYSVSA